jgi:hypothetical protein
VKKREKKKANVLYMYLRLGGPTNTYCLLSYRVENERKNFTWGVNRKQKELYSNKSVCVSLKCLSPREDARAGTL